MLLAILLVDDPERAGTPEDVVFSESFLDIAPIAAPSAVAPIAAAATTFFEGDFFSSCFGAGALIFGEDGALFTEAPEDFALTLPAGLADFGAAFFAAGFTADWAAAGLAAPFTVFDELGFADEEAFVLTGFAAGFDALFTEPFAAAFVAGFAAAFAGADLAGADFAVGFALFTADFATGLAAAFAGFFVCFAM